MTASKLLKSWALAAICVCGASVAQAKSVSGKYVDPKAEKLCSQVMLPSEQDRCVNSVVGLAFIDEEIEICQSEPMDAEKIICLMELGVPVERL